MKKKVLVIDDDALVLKSVRNLLTRKGHEVILAKTGDEAESGLRQNEIDLIISDIRMPGRDGITVVTSLKKICEEELKKEIPFLFMTGYASEEAPIDALKLGAKDYLLKPLDLDEFMASVNKHIGE